MARVDAEGLAGWWMALPSPVRETEASAESAVCLSRSRRFSTTQGLWTCPVVASSRITAPFWGEVVLKSGMSLIEPAI